MRALLTCSKCAFETTLSEEDRLTLYYAELIDDRTLKLTCKMGHETAIIQERQLFQLLFEHAMLAYDDGYEREAVASIAACLERFYEFATAALLRSFGVEGPAISGLKKVLSRSEPQLGGYIAAYTMATGELPLLLSRNMTELRNNTIHGGAFPTPEAASKLIEEVLTIIRDSLSKTWSKHAAGFQAQIAADVGHRASRVPGTPIVSSGADILWIGQDFGVPDFASALERTRTFRMLRYKGPPDWRYRERP